MESNSSCVVDDAFVDKVISGLKCHLGDDKNHYDCDHCPYGPMSAVCDAILIRDALAVAQVYKERDATAKKALQIYGKNLRRIYTGKG